MNRTNTEHRALCEELRDLASTSIYLGDNAPKAMVQAADTIESLQAELRRYDEGVSAVLNGLTTPDLFFQEAHEAARTRGTT